jgi:hypothetical protein
MHIDVQHFGDVLSPAVKEVQPTIFDGDASAFSLPHRLMPKI